MTPLERAEALLDEIDGWIASHQLEIATTARQLEIATAAFRTADAQAYEDAREDAAKVADKVRCEAIALGQAAKAITAEEIAIAIRELKP